MVYNKGKSDLEDDKWGTPILGNLQLVLEEMSEEDEETYGQHLRFGLAMDGVGLWMVLNTCHGH